MRKTDLTPARPPPGVMGKLGESEGKRESTLKILCAPPSLMRTSRRVFHSPKAHTIVYIVLSY